MHSARKLLPLLILALLAAPLAASAATDTETLTMNATVANRAKLIIVPTTINFPDEDPDLVDPIPALENAVNVYSRVRTSGAGTSTLTCQANGDLTSGGDVIGIDNVTWTSVGAGYVDGTMDAAVAQTVGSWTGSGSYTGTFDFFLANSWDYNVGNYTADRDLHADQSVANTGGVVMESRRTPFRAVHSPEGVPSLRWLRVRCYGGAVGPSGAEPASIRLRLNGAVSFPDADPDLVPAVGPETVSLDIEVLGRPGTPGRLPCWPTRISSRGPT